MGKASRKRREARAATSVAVKAKPAAAPQIIPSEKLQRLDFLLFLVVVAGAFSVYFRTLSPSIYTTGAGENVTAAATLGVPHPPGFPLFCLLAKLFTLAVPVGRIAYRVNLFSAAAGSTASGLLFFLIRKISGTRPVALTAAFLFAFSQTFWSQAVIAEVYTLNAVLLLSIFLLLLRWDQGGSLLPAGFAAGLGLAVHPLQAIFFTGWIWFILRSERSKKLRTRQIIETLAVLTAGASLHFYAPIRSAANPVLDWGNPQTFSGFLQYITAAQYRGRMFSMPASQAARNLIEASKILFGQFSPWLFVLPAAGTWFCYRANRRLFFTTAIPAFLTIVYAINYDIPWEIDVYYIPVALVLSFWAAFALKFLAQHLKSAAYALPLIAVVPLIHNFYLNDRSQHTIALALGEDILSTCPQNATLIVPNTDATFAVLYLTAVEHQRPDVSIWVFGDQGIRSLPDALNPEVVPITEPALLKMKSNVFQYGRVTADTISGFEPVPYGVLYQIVQRGKKPSLPAIDFASYHLQRFASPTPGFYLDDRSRIILANYHFSRGDADFALGREETARQEYAKAESVGSGIADVEDQLASRAGATGDVETAIAHLRTSLASHEDAVTQNKLGRLLAETHHYEEAMSAFDRAIQLDPNLAIAHSNLGALLGMQGKLTQAFAELQLAVRLDPNSTLAHNNLGRACLMKKDYTAAVAEFQKSLLIDPGQDQIKEQLAKLKGTHQALPN